MNEKNRKVEERMQEKRQQQSKTLDMEDSNYYIDFIPKRCNEHYEKVKNYLLTHYIELYEDKMIRILLKLMLSYNLRMYLTDFSTEEQNSKAKQYAHLVGTDLMSLPIEEWVAAVKFVIKENVSSIQVLSNTPRFLFSINGGLCNELRRIPQSDVSLLKSLVEGEGLYLIKMEAQEE